LQVALKHRLPKPLRHFRIPARFAFIRNPGNDVHTTTTTKNTFKKILSVPHTTCCDGCARDAEQNRYEKRVCSVINSFIVITVFSEKKRSQTKTGCHL